MPAPLRLRALPFAIIVLCAGLCARGADSARVVRLRGDSWMPYNGEPSAPAPGYAVEIARAIFEPAGYSVDYQVMPWADAMQAVKTGAIEGVIGAGAAELKGLVVPREPIGMPVFGLFVRSESTFAFANLSSLQKVRLGAVAGYSYWDALDTYIQGHRDSNRVRLQGGETPLLDAINLLDHGELDVIVEGKTVWLWTIKSSGRSNKDYRPVFQQPGDPIYIAFSPGAGASLAKIFDEGMARLRASGQLGEILKKYLVGDWQ